MYYKIYRYITQMFNDHFIPGDKIIQPLHKNKKGNMKIKKAIIFRQRRKLYKNKSNVTVLKHKT